MAGTDILQTEKVIVFPSARRAIQQPDARLMTEKNLVSIINKLVDKEGFIISKKEDIINVQEYVAETKPIEFNIFGYYFKIDKIKDIIDLDNVKGAGLSLYAYINLQTSGELTELKGQDVDNYYEGLHFTTDESELKSDDPSIVKKNLKLFERDIDIEGQWYPCDESFIKFNRESVYFDIDGGEF